ncbi:uncharacterized protein LOC116955885 isoform X2 [Petromyzon marinus]|uniref:uncharacterized protein LOC116955885 isoform X2 n=1 Tax=Petromyzon marinus TaxID=7757 RepID=UPI003F707AB7
MLERPGIPPPSFGTRLAGMQGPMLHLTWLALVATAHADVNQSSSTEISPLLDEGLPKPSLTILRSTQVNSTEPLRPNANNSHTSEQPQAQEDFIHSTKALRVVTSSAVSDDSRSSSTKISPLLDEGLPKPSLTILRSTQVNSTEPLRPNANNSHTSEQPQAQEDFIHSTKALRLVASSAVSDDSRSSSTKMSPLLDEGLPKPSASLTTLRSAQVNSTEPLQPNANNSHVPDDAHGRGVVDAAVAVASMIALSESSGWSAGAVAGVVIGTIAVVVGVVVGVNELICKDRRAQSGRLD